MHTTTKPERRVSRRRYLQAVPSALLGAAVSGCIETRDDPLSDDDRLLDAPPADPVTIEWATGPFIAQHPQAFLELLRRAGLPESISIEFRSLPQTTNARLAHINHWFERGTPAPTLLNVDSGWTIPLIGSGNLVNLSHALPVDVTESVQNQYYEAVVSTARCDGDLYAIPLFPEFGVMFYRKDLVVDAGYDPEGENWATSPLSWRRFTDVTADVRARSPVQYGFTFQADEYEGLACCTFNEVMTSFGGAYFGGRERLFGPVGDRPITVDSEPVRRAIRLYRTLLYGDEDPRSLGRYAGRISPTAVLNWQEILSRKPFVREDAVMHRNWMTFLRTLLDTNEDMGEKLGLMPLPYGVRPEHAQYPGTGGSASALGGWHLAMNANAPRQKRRAAVSVYRAVMQESFMRDANALLGWLPPRPGVLEGTDSASQPMTERYAQTIRYAGRNAIPRPVTSVWPVESSAIAAQVHLSLQRRRSPKRAMAVLENQLADIEASA